MTATSLEIALDIELSHIGHPIGNRQYQQDFMSVVVNHNANDLPVGFQTKNHPYNRVDHEEHISLDPDAWAAFMRRSALNQLILVEYGLVLRHQPGFLHNENSCVRRPHFQEVFYEIVSIDDLRGNGLTRTRIFCVPTDDSFQNYEITDIFALQETGDKATSIDSFFHEYDRFEAQGSVSSSGNVMLPVQKISQSVRNYLMPEHISDNDYFETKPL